MRAIRDDIAAATARHSAAYAHCRDIDEHTMTMMPRRGARRRMLHARYDVVAITRAIRRYARARTAARQRRAFD